MIADFNAEAALKAHEESPKAHGVDTIQALIKQNTEAIAPHEEQIRKLSKAIETHRKEKNQGFLTE